MSTTQKYDPYENAVAERINGILKYEFGLGKTLSSVEIAKKIVGITQLNYYVYFVKVTTRPKIYL